MDANEKLHIDWIGMAQPQGLVVTPATLKAAEANITWPVTELQETLRDLAGKAKVIPNLPAFFREILGWSGEFLVSGADIPATLRVHVEGSAPLAPSYAMKSADDEGAFVLLVGEAPAVGGDLDAASDDKRWTASAHQRFERLLRETGVHVGLLANGKVFRLVYAPKGETAGWVDFRLSEMLTVDGRPLLGAMHMLLNERRLLSLDADKRLGALLRASREYQSTVSNALREQVLSALRALLVGFQNADRLAGGAVLGSYREHGRLDEVYKGLVTVLMRSVFVLFAEEQNLLPMDRELYAQSYSLSRLYAQLLEDRGRHGDTIEDRYGAWARMIALFRMLHDGMRAADGTTIPKREGDFFDPDAFPFLEGRPRESKRQREEIRAPLDLPRVSDGVIFRVLDQLLVLGGERLQYKGLDVEQIGSVYEGLMGFELEVAEGASLTVKPEHVVVNLEALLALAGAERLKQLKAEANLDLKDKAAAAVKAASTVSELEAALARHVSPRQPGLLAMGSLYLQPGQERRKTGSHYTPKSLTSPIVETTLRPVLERLGPEVTPDQILDLKVCDPAMGSGAFLVEACRQLADHLVAAWRRTKQLPDLPPDEDLVLHARRLVAQRCLYGVDKNPLAVDLARLSMWLVTFAREHPFTFVDHALRHGDSLVGLSSEQIYNLSFDPAKGHKLAEQARNTLLNAVRRAEKLRRELQSIGDPPNNERLKELWREANEALATVRIVADAMVASYFAHDSDKARKRALEDLLEKVPAWLLTGQYGAELLGMVAGLREGAKGVPAFHWEAEFPEVFAGDHTGFNAFVGNPPFLGGTRISVASGLAYRDWLAMRYASSSLTDLVAYFFRRAFELLASGGALGFVATNSISQGDTRATGLTWICQHGGEIYAATRRLRWPGQASVVVSVVHATRGRWPTPVLDGRPVNRISAYLFHAGGDESPGMLRVNRDVSVIGSFILGIGFVFEDAHEGATPLSEMRRLLDKDPRNRERIFPYLGGEELNTSPTQAPSRFVIDFGEASEAEARTWPDLFSILETKVRPARASVAQRDRRELWWLHATRSPEMKRFVAQQRRCLAVSQVTSHLAFAWIHQGIVVSHTTVLILRSEDSAFSLLQSRVHEAWARLLASSMKDDLRYTPTDCFETFPQPTSSPASPALEVVGREYHAHRAALMVANNEGLTKTYNRFHDPEERSPGILKLRDLHAQMDRAVLDAYGWTDIQPVYDFREQLDESIRLTWAEDTRDEVLARLLELNRVMAEKEAAEAAASAKPSKKTASKKRAAKESATLELPLAGKNEDSS